MSIFAQDQHPQTKRMMNHITRYFLILLTHHCGTVRFLQVGANDGVRADPINEFIRGRRWAGVLVEPIPEVFAKLLETYEGIDGLAFENTAIAPRSGTQTFYRVLEPHSPLSSFDRDTILKAKVDNIEDLIDPIEIDTETIEAVIERHQLQPDIVVVDTEGYDCKALMTMNIALHKPRIIYFEHVHCPDEDTKIVRRILEDNEYVIFFDKFNALAIRHWPDRFLIRTFEKMLRDSDLNRKARKRRS